MKKAKRWAALSLAAAMMLTPLSGYAMTADAGAHAEYTADIQSEMVSQETEDEAEAEVPVSETEATESETETEEVTEETAESETETAESETEVIESETAETEEEETETEDIELEAVTAPKPVTNIKAEAQSPSRVKISWTASASSETVGYLVYVKRGKKDTFKYLTMTTRGTTVTDTKAISSDYNYYRVYAYVKDEKDKMIPSVSDKYVFAKFMCAPVQDVKGYSYESSAAIRWSAADYADGYLIYGKRGTGAYGYVGKTTDTLYVDRKAYQTVWNYYWIYPYYLDDQGQMVTTQKYTKYAYGHRHFGGTATYSEGKRCQLCKAVYGPALTRAYQTPGDYCKIQDDIYIPGCYVSPIRVDRSSSREECIEVMINRAYEYLNAGTVYYEPSSEAPGGHCDCSGLAMQCLLAAGIHMTDMDGEGDITPVTHLWPGHEYESRRMGDSSRFMDVSLGNRQRGDLVFYRNSRGIIYHVAIYLGNDMVIDSNSVDWRVNVVPLFRSSYNATTITVKRPFP